MGQPSSGIQRIGVVDKSGRDPRRGGRRAAHAGRPRRGDRRSPARRPTGSPWRSRCTGCSRATRDGRFVLGPRVGELAAALPDPLVAAAAPVLAWVRDECGESAQLYRRDGAERVCVAAAERASGLRTTVPVGSRLPLTAGSGAQVLCAWSEGPDPSSRRARWPRCAGAAGRSRSRSARPAWRRCRRRCCAGAERCSQRSRSPARSSDSAARPARVRARAHRRRPPHHRRARLTIGHRGCDEPVPGRHQEVAT